MAPIWWSVKFVLCPLAFHVVVNELDDGKDNDSKSTGYTNLEREKGKKEQEF